ncbi:MAG: copper chaperone PCu(A)C [Alphaproteobacteria bacterium]|nr:copper chaperone PCu(A)C [Alphaproteobacteria bacterium]
MRVLMAAGIAVGAAFASSLFAAREASARDFRLGDIVIDQPIALPTARAGASTSVFLTFINHGGADRLIAASSVAAERAEIRAPGAPTGGLALPAHRSVQLRPGGAHILLIGLSGPLAAGDGVPVRLQFERAGLIEIVATVEAAPA